MMNAIFVTGGARSGKSRFAEKLAEAAGEKVLYVATAVATDNEMDERIRHHKESRPKWWSTYEGYRGFETEKFTELAKEYGVVIVDCLTVMCTNLMFDFSKGMDIENATIDTQAAEELERRVLIEVNGLMNALEDAKVTAIYALEDAKVTAIYVSNEVGMGLVPEYPLGRLFRDIAGRVNQRVASRATEGYFCVSGIPMKIK